MEKDWRLNTREKLRVVFNFEKYKEMVLLFSMFPPMLVIGAFMQVYYNLKYYEVNKQKWLNQNVCLLDNYE